MFQFLRFRMGWAAAVLGLAFFAIFGLTIAQDSQGPGIPNPSDHIGDTPLTLSESSAAIRRSTPEDLVETILAARDQKDLSALSRCSSTSAGRFRLDQLDEARAERDFFDSSAKLWDSLRNASVTRQLKVESTTLPVAEGNPPVTARGEILIPMPKNTAGAGLEEMSLRIVQIAGEWYLEVAQ